jgi:hypothetical protein
MFYGKKTKFWSFSYGRKYGKNVICTKNEENSTNLFLKWVLCHVLFLYFPRKSRIFYFRFFLLSLLIKYSLWKLLVKSLIPPVKMTPAPMTQFATEIRTFTCPTNNHNASLICHSILPQLAPHWD